MRLPTAYTRNSAPADTACLWMKRPTALENPQRRARLLEAAKKPFTDYGTRRLPRCDCRGLRRLPRSRSTATSRPRQTCSRHRSRTGSKPQFQHHGVESLGSAETRRCLAKIGSSLPCTDAKPDVVISTARCMARSQDAGPPHPFRGRPASHRGCGERLTCAPRIVRAPEGERSGPSR